MSVALFSPACLKFFLHIYLKTFLPSKTTLLSNVFWQMCIVFTSHNASLIVLKTNRVKYSEWDGLSLGKLNIWFFTSDSINIKQNIILEDWERHWSIKQNKNVRDIERFPQFLIRISMTVNGTQYNVVTVNGTLGTVNGTLYFSPR